MRLHVRRSAVVMVVTGLLALGGVSPAFAQKGSKPDAKPAAAPPKAATTPPPAAGKPAAAPDDPKKEEARALYKKAEAAKKEGDYVAALALYRKAEAILPIAMTKYKIAHCLDKLGNVRLAVTSYKTFLESKPDPDKMKDLITDAQARTAELEKTPGKVRLAITPASPPGLQLGLDGATVKGTEVPAPNGAAPFVEISAPPGHHTVIVGASGFETTTESLDIGFAETKEVPITLRGKGATAAASGPGLTLSKADAMKASGYALAGIGVLGVVLGSVYGVKALSAKSDFANQPTDYNASLAETHALVSDLGIFIGIPVLAAGAGLVVLGTMQERKNAPGKGAPPKSGIVVPYASPNGGGLTGVFVF